MYGYYDDYEQRQQMQRRMMNLQRQQQAFERPVAPPAGLKGRPVTSIEEARAAQIDLDGSSTFFPCPAEGKIYEKFLGLDGLPIFRVYQIMRPQEQKQPVYAERSYVDNLMKRVDNLEKALGGVQHDEPDATNGNVTEQR